MAGWRDIEVCRVGDIVGDDTSSVRPDRRQSKTTVQGGKIGNGESNSTSVVVGGDGPSQMGTYFNATVREKYTCRWPL